MIIHNYTIKIEKYTIQIKICTIQIDKITHFNVLLALVIDE